MNAYELADELDKINDIPIEAIINMLRQQADRIAELEKQSEPVAWRYRWKNSKGQFSTAWQVCIEEPITDDERFYLEPLYTTPQTKPENTWTSCVACGQRVTGDSIHTCSPQTKPQCEHEIVDARNEFVESGYMCIKCMSLFKGRHTTPQTKPLSDEEIAELENALDVCDYKYFGSYEFSENQWKAFEILEKYAKEKLKQAIEAKVRGQ